MTTTETTEKKAPKKTAPAAPTPTKRDKEAAATATPGAATVPFGTKVQDEHTTLECTKIGYPPFDSRATDVPLTEDFKKSIKQDGVLVPILVGQLEDGSYVVVAGRRRLRASLEVGHKTIPAYVKKMTDREARVYCINENLQRQGLTAWDVANSFKDLKDHGMSQTEIAKSVGKSDGYVSQHLSIFDLDPKVQTMVRQNKFEPGTTAKVRELVRVKDTEKQVMLAQDTVENEWTSNDIKNQIANLEAKERARAAAAKERKRAAKAADADGADEGEAEEPADFEAKYKEAEVKAPTVTKLRTFLAGVDARIDRIRASEEVDELKLAYENGMLDAAKMLTGLKKLPKTLGGE